MSDFAYVGSELNLFAGATTWKCYVRFHLQRYLSGDILEVGAGIGASTATFCDGTQRRWVCLEPDRDLADRIKPKSTRGADQLRSSSWHLVRFRYWRPVRQHPVHGCPRTYRSRRGRARARRVASEAEWLSGGIIARIPMAVYAVRCSHRPLSPLYKKFPAFDRPPGYARSKMHLSGLGRAVGVAGKQTLPALAHPKQSPDPILGPYDGPDIEVRRPGPEPRDRQINPGSLAESPLDIPLS